MAFRDLCVLPERLVAHRGAPGVPCITVLFSPTTTTTKVVPLAPGLPLGGQGGPQGVALPGQGVQGRVGVPRQGVQGVRLSREGVQGVAFPSQGVQGGVGVPQGVGLPRQGVQRVGLPSQGVKGVVLPGLPVPEGGLLALQPLPGLLPLAHLCLAERGRGFRSCRSYNAIYDGSKSKGFELSVDDHD